MASLDLGVHESIATTSRRELEQVQATAAPAPASDPAQSRPPEQRQAQASRALPAAVQASTSRIQEYCARIGERGTWINRQTGQLQHQSRARATRGQAENLEWCGAFAAYHWTSSGGLNPRVATSLQGTGSIRQLCSYSGSPRLIEVNGRTMPVESYHAARGSRRRYTGAGEIEPLLRAGNYAALDLRPGDIVLIDVSGTAAADHVTMVRSWDGAGDLRTIEGNSGDRVRSNDLSTTLTGGEHAAAEGAAPGRRDARYRRNSDGGRSLVVRAIARLSVVDFEEHRYTDAPQGATPAST
jgi:hypothetical protein